MATRTQLDKQVLSVLKYDASRPYFGDFKFSDLYDAQRTMRRDEFYDENGSRDMRVYVGKINGDVICRTLWRQMEYNPGRFTTNPFVYNGVYNIFRFASDTIVPAEPTTARIITDVRGKLRDFLFANAAENGQWRDEIVTNDGFVYTILKDGRTGPMYKKLCMLRDAIKFIAGQNCIDFESKRGPYREHIIQAAQRLHPAVFNPTPVRIAPQQPATTQVVVPVDTTEEDKIYDQMDHLQITLDNRGSVSSELYEQASDEMAHLMKRLTEIRHQHTL